ncbi:hypothetical protein [Bacillus sp. FSL K6-0067]
MVTRLGNTHNRYEPTNRGHHTCPSTPLHIPSEEDVPSSTCIPKRIL